MPDPLFLVGGPVGLAPGPAALAVAAFGYGGLSVLHTPDLAESLLNNVGREFSPPEMSVEQGTRVMRFLALSAEGSRLFQVTGRIGARVSIDANEELASVP